MEPQELSLNCEALEEFVENFNQMLRGMARELDQKDLESGVLTAKIKMERSTHVDQNGEIMRMVNIEPKMNVKLSEEYKADISRTGFMEMKFDRNGRPIIGSNQISMDELLKGGKKNGAA